MITVKTGNTLIRSVCGMFCKIVGNWRFVYLLLLAWFCTCLPYYVDPSFVMILRALVLTSLVNLCIFALLTLVKRLKLLYNLLFIILALYINVFMLVEAFVLMNFGKPLDLDVLFLIQNTNAREANEFVRTYLTFQYILGCIVVVTALNMLLVFVSKILVTKFKHLYSAFMALATVCGVVMIGWAFVVVYVFHSGNRLSEQNMFLKSVYLYQNRNNDYALINRFMKYQEDLVAHVGANACDSTIYIVVIGESHNKHHSSVYGYELDTQPFSSKRISEGQMIAFDDCIAPYFDTFRVMKALYSYGSSVDDYMDYPLFPQVFKVAGYSVYLYDNQFFTLDRPRHFLNSGALSDQMFDYRNPQIYGYDEEIIDIVDVPKPRSLVIVNLNGQHYEYDKRMPADFERRFKPELYDGRSPDQAQVLAAYDNSIVYVDSLLDVLIGKFENENACLFYFSDHGQEVYDLEDIYGHGMNREPKDYKYQIDIPFMVWGSDSFRQTDKWEKLLDARSLRITTADFAHLITDLAGIETDVLDKTRSCVDPEYDNGRHRMFLFGLDYDE